jgi:hypothetical protein
MFTEKDSMDVSRTSIRSNKIEIEESAESPPPAMSFWGAKEQSKRFHERLAEHKKITTKQLLMGVLVMLFMFLFVLIPPAIAVIGSKDSELPIGLTMIGSAVIALAVAIFVIKNTK